jgi:hypothetical protein
VNPLRPLTAAEMAQVKACRSFPRPDSSRQRPAVKWLTLDPDGGVSIHVVVLRLRFAVRRHPVGQILYKEFAVISPSGDILVRDCAWSRCAGHAYDWSDVVPREQPKEWNPPGERHRFIPGSLSGDSAAFTFPCAPVLNPGLLAQSPRYRWCAWTPECEEIAAYLRRYAAFPAIEHLSKAGLRSIAASPSVLARLQADRAFVRFVHANAAAIRETRILPSDLLRAYRRGEPVADMAERRQAIRAFGARGGGGCHLHPAVEPLAAWRYLRGQTGASSGEYDRYIDNCAELGLDLRDPRVCRPADFHAAALDIAERLAARRPSASARLGAALRRRAAALNAALGDLSHTRYIAAAPATRQEFAAEGEALGHCLGTHGYFERAARRETLIAFIRLAAAPGAPLYTVEASATARRVLQCRGLHNSLPPESARAFAEGPLLAALRRGLAARSHTKTKGTRE